MKGVFSADRTRSGCPARALSPSTAPDADGDGIPDAEDACPDAKGVASADRTRHGCPGAGAGLVRLTSERLELLQAVLFEPSRDVLKAESEPLLAEVARVLNAHPEIALVRIEGHTDSQGSPPANLELSGRRAAAVRRWLAERGRVALARLAAEGYGQTQPIADNATADGRARNRRVEFRILRPKP